MRFIFAVFAVSLGLAVLAVGVATFEAKAQQESATFRIGVVDLQEIASRSAVGKASQERIRKFFEEKKRNLDEKETSLQQESTTLQNQRAVLSQDVFDRRKNDLEQRLLAFQQERDAAQGELERMQQQELDSFARVVGPVIEAIGRETGVEVILDRRQGVYYFDPRTDLTDQVIQRLESSSAGN